MIDIVQQHKQYEGLDMTKRSAVLIPRLYHIRLERGLTAAALAETSGVNRQTIARIERGYPASVPTVARLAKALNMTVDELLAASPS